MSGFVHLDVEEVVRITEKAILLRIDGDEIWFPVSQVANADDYEEGDADLTVSVTEWAARQKGLGD